MTAVIRSMDSLKGADAAEWQARVHLAAAFRLANRAGWNEGIANHFSMIVPGSTDRYLLNPRELHFSEITASNLIVVDEKGNRLAGHGQVRAVAFYLHGRLHKALPGAKCILHAHAPYSTAISLVRGGRHPFATLLRQNYELNECSIAGCRLQYGSIVLDSFGRFCRIRSTDSCQIDLH